MKSMSSAGCCLKAPAAPCSLPQRLSCGGAAVSGHPGRLSALMEPDLEAGALGSGIDGGGTVQGCPSCLWGRMRGSRWVQSSKGHSLDSQTSPGCL